MGYYRSGKAIYFTNRADAAFEDERIADCESEEKAHCLVDALEKRSQNYIRNALKTLSPDFHAKMVGDKHFRRRLNDAIYALNHLDQIKKSLFYGRDNNLISLGLQDATFIPKDIHSDSAVAIDIIHAILGFATEAGELLEALKEGINGNGFDWVNIQEELGDAAWYAAILAEHGDFTFEDYEQKNIAKLRARYPDSFGPDYANNRDLAAERAILEDRCVDDGELSMGAKANAQLAPSVPASGKEAVEAVQQSADAAFDAMLNRPDRSVDGAAPSGNPELAKSAGERERLLPDEHLSRQPIRPEDAQK